MTFSREIDRTVRLTLTTAEIKTSTELFYDVIYNMNLFCIDGVPTVENEDYIVWRFLGGFNEDFMKIVLKRMGII